MKHNAAKSLIPAPQIRPDNREFWQAAAKSQLLVRRCLSCDHVHWYPRAACPQCLSDTTWELVSGRAVVYTYSVIRRAAPEPFCIAYVQLAEGPLVMTNLVDCDLDNIKIGEPVHVVFKPSSDGTMVPMFTK